MYGLPASATDTETVLSVADLAEASVGIGPIARVLS